MHYVKVGFTAKDLREGIPENLPKSQTTKKIILASYFLLVCNFGTTVYINREE